jgi:ferredoxin
MDGVELRKKIDETLEPLRPITWGVCDMDPSLPLPYKKGLVVTVPYSHKITLEDFSDPFLRSLQAGCKGRIDVILKQLTGLFHSLGIDYTFAPHSGNSQEFEDRMTEAYNVKEAARCAGLGWIGKSTLLVTREFGPRLSIILILLNEDLKADKPVEKSSCGECDRCSRNCPFQAIKNTIWKPKLPRLEQLDYITCSHSRLAMFDKVGRKIGCGKCIASCPNGNLYQNGSLKFIEHPTFQDR